MPRAKAEKSIIYCDKHFIKYAGKTVGFSRKIEGGYSFIPTDKYELALPTAIFPTLRRLTVLVEQELAK